MLNLTFNINIPFHIDRGNSGKNILIRVNKRTVQGERIEEIELREEEMDGEKMNKENQKRSIRKEMKNSKREKDKYRDDVIQQRKEKTS